MDTDSGPLLPPCPRPAIKPRCRDVSPAVVSVSESCDHFQTVHGGQDPALSTKQNSRRSFR